MAFRRIEAAFTVRELDDGIDHRLLAPPAATGFASGAWRRVVGHKPLTSTVEVNGRSLPVATSRRGAPVETTFADLCGSPWSSGDYLTLLSDGVGGVVLHDVPDPARLGREPAQRLANLVDVAYDLDVPMIVYSAGAPVRLRDAVVPPLDVARTVSRLATLRLW